MPFESTQGSRRRCSDSGSSSSCVSDSARWAREESCDRGRRKGRGLAIAPFERPRGCPRKPPAVLLQEEAALTKPTTTGIRNCWPPTKRVPPGGQRITNRGAKRYWSLNAPRTSPSHRLIISVSVQNKVPLRLCPFWSRRDIGRRSAL